MEDLTKCIELTPDYAEAYFYRGLCNIVLINLTNPLPITLAQQKAEAVADFEKVIELSSDEAMIAAAQQQIEALQ